MNEKNKKRIVYSTLFFLLILFLLLLLVRCHPSGSDVSVLPQNGALVSDTVSQEELQQMMDDSMIAISINATPVFADANSQGNLQIENLAINKRLLRVEIYLNSDVDAGDLSSYALTRISKTTRLTLNYRLALIHVPLFFGLMRWTNRMNIWALPVPVSPLP